MRKKNLRPNSSDESLELDYQMINVNVYNAFATLPYKHNDCHGLSSYFPIEHRAALQQNFHTEKRTNATLNFPTKQRAKKSSTGKQMTLWNRLFNFGGSTRTLRDCSKQNQQQHHQSRNVEQQSPERIAKTGIYNSIRRRVNSKKISKSSSPNSPLKPPSTIELLQEQQKRLAVIAATPKLGRATESVGSKKEDFFDQNHEVEEKEQIDNCSPVSVRSERSELCAIEKLCYNETKLDKFQVTAPPERAAVLCKSSPRTSSKPLTPLYEASETCSSSQKSDRTFDDMRNAQTTANAFDVVERVIPRRNVLGIANTDRVSRKQRNYFNEASSHRFLRSSLSSGFRFSCSSAPSSPWMHERRESMLLKQARRPSEESLVTLMSCSSSASYVNYKPCCHQVRQRHKSPSSIGGGSSSRSSITEFSHDGRHRAYRRSTKRLCLKAGEAPNASAQPPWLSRLSPMTFELPVFDSDELYFVHRGWFYTELFDILVNPASENDMLGAVVFGPSGSGKTTLVHHLAACCPSQQSDVDGPNVVYDSPSQISHSHFSASSDSGFVSANSKPINGRPSVASAARHRGDQRIRQVADCVIGYHFCQIESQATCSLPNFLHNIASMVALNLRSCGYGELFADKRLDKVESSMHDFYQNPVETFRQLVTEPLKKLRVQGKLFPNEREQVNMLICVDAIDEAEFHRPDSSDSIGSFLVRCGQSVIPSFVKLVLTVRSGNLDLLKGLPLHKIDLDQSAGEHIYHDSFEYVSKRIESCLAVQANIVSKSASAGLESGLCPLARFAEHLASIGRGNFLYMRSVLDLIQQNYVVIKGANYRVLPVNLSEAFNLMLSLRFSTEWSFRQISTIFQIMLSTLRPLTAEQLFGVMNAGLYDHCVTWSEFQEKLSQLQEFIVLTQNKTFIFFHPTFREWLLDKSSTKSSRFAINVKHGHASIALWLTRRSPERSLNAEEMIELGHHLLKAHIFKSAKVLQATKTFPTASDCQLAWLNHSAVDLQSCLCAMSNVFQPNTKVSKLLLLAGASANACTQYYSNAPLLCVAARHGLYNFALLLLEFNANVNCVDMQLQCPVIHAAIGGHLDLIQMLQEHGAQINQIDAQSKCALIHAAEQGHVDVVSFLLQCDWCPQFKPNYPLSSRQQVIQQAFVAAAGSSKISVCKFLFDFYDIDINATDLVTSENALSIACSCGSKDTVSYLLKCGVCVNLGRSTRPTPPLLMAVKNGCWEVVSALLSAGVNVNSEMDDQGRTALMYAAEYGNIGVMELLLGRDANVNLVDNDNRNSLAWACIGNQELCASLLLERGSRIFIHDKQGNFPTHYAAKYGSKNLLMLFLERRISLEQSNNHGIRPLDISIEADNFDTFQCLLKRGAKLSPRTWTEAYKKPEFIVLLLEKLLEDGYLLYKKGTIKDALHRFEYATRKMSDQRLVYQEADNYKSRLKMIKYNLLLGISRCKRRETDYNEAIEKASQAIQLDPDRYEAYFVRAKCQCESKNWVAAKSDFLKVQRLHPDNREVERSLIRLEKLLGQPADTATALSNATGQTSSSGSLKDSVPANVVEQRLTDSKHTSQGDRPPSTYTAFQSSVTKKMCQKADKWPPKKKVETEL